MELFCLLAAFVIAAPHLANRIAALAHESESDEGENHEKTDA